MRMLAKGPGGCLEASVAARQLRMSPADLAGVLEPLNRRSRRDGHPTAVTSRRQIADDGSRRRDKILSLAQGLDSLVAPYDNRRAAGGRPEAGRAAPAALAGWRETAVEGPGHALNGWVSSANPNRYDLHANSPAATPGPSTVRSAAPSTWTTHRPPGQVMALNQVGGAPSGALLGHGVIVDYPLEATVTPSWLAPGGRWLDPKDLGRTLWFVEFDFTWLASPIPYPVLKADPDFGRSLFIRSSGRSNSTRMDLQAERVIIDIIEHRWIRVRRSASSAPPLLTHTRTAPYRH
jgi:hypothetical protein